MVQHIGVLRFFFLMYDGVDSAKASGPTTTAARLDLQAIQRMITENIYLNRL